MIERHVPEVESTPAPAEFETPMEAARVQPPQPSAAEIREVPAYEPQPEPVPEVPSYEAPQEAAPEVQRTSPKPEMRIDRAVVVRELASLFGEDDSPAPAQSGASRGGDGQAARGR